MSRIGSLIVGLILTLVGMVPSFTAAMETSSPPTIELVRAVHFLTPGGDDVVVGPGFYEVEVAEIWLRLIPQGGERADALLLAADRMPHTEKVDTSQVLLSEGKGIQQVMLLLPTGQSLVASGSISGPSSQSISEVRTRGIAAWGRPNNFPKCLQGALHGPEARFVILYYEYWHCKPVKLIKVDHPQFKSLVLQSGLPLPKQSLRNPKSNQAQADDFFNKLYKDLRLASAPKDTHLMIGQLSRHISAKKDDQAYYIFALRRVSADEIVIHSARATFKRGSMFSTPVFGPILKYLIKYGVEYLTEVPKSGDAAVRIIKAIEKKTSSGNEDSANLIATVIALSALPLLPEPPFLLPPAQIMVVLPR